MPHFGCLPDVPLFNSILKISSLPPSEAYPLFARMKTEFGLRPDVVTYVYVVKKLCEDGRLKDARVLVERMEEENGCTPNVVVYSALLEGACGCGELEAGHEILEEMERKGEMNVVTYTCLMKWLCEVGKVDEALMVLDRMVMNGCRPNRVTLRTLIRGFCVEGRLDDVYKIIDKVKAYDDNDGSVSGDEFYSLLVLCLLRVGERKKAELLLCRMLEMNVKPDGAVCNSLLREICEKRCFLEVYGWINAFEAKSVNCVDSDVYSLLLQGLCEEGRKEEVLSLGRTIIENEVKVEESCVHRVVEMMEKMGEGDLASLLLKIREENRSCVVA